LLAGELAVLDGVHAHDAAGDIAICDALHLERMQAAEGGDLLETEGGVVNEPDGSGLWHQQGRGHDKSLSPVRPVSPGRPASGTMLRGNCDTYTGSGSGFQSF